MRTLFDDQVFSSQSDGGISRYFVELMQAFGSDSSLDVDLVDPKMWTKNRYLIESGMGRKLPAPLDRRPVLRFANRRRGLHKPLDLVHHTYYYPEYLRRFSSNALHVVTVYDMIPELFPEWFPHGNPHQSKRSFVDAADLILCISETTQRDLVRVYGEPKAPMVVTPLGVSAQFRPGTRAPDNFPDRFVLFVGSRGAYKDFDVLAEAFAAATQSAKDVWLVAVGGRPFTDDERAKLEKLGISGRTLQQSVSDSDLARAYASAECFVFPSRYEGFGLPTLEAMASGCLTIVAESPAHVEVGGDAAFRFPPGDAGSLSRLLAEVLSDSDHSARRDLGIAHAARFTWSNTASLTAAAYREHLVDA